MVGRIGRNVMRGWLAVETTPVLRLWDELHIRPKTSAHLLTYDSILEKLDPAEHQTTDGDGGGKRNQIFR